MDIKTERSKTGKRTTTKLLVYYAVAITLSLTIGECSGKLLQAPTNKTVYVGSRATLQCQTDLPLTVFWYFNDKEIFYGGRISLEYSSKFEIETGSTSDGKYHLVIPSADTSYNGRYTCGDDEGQGEKQSAWVTVTDSPTTVEPVPLPTTGVSMQIIGIIIGVTVGVIAIVIILAYCLSKRRRIRQNRNKNQDNYTNTAATGRSKVQDIIKQREANPNETIPLPKTNYVSKPKNPISPKSEKDKSKKTIESEVNAESVVATGNDSPSQENAKSNSEHTEDDALLDTRNSEDGQSQNETTEQQYGAGDINGKGEETTDKENGEKAPLV